MENESNGTIACDIAGCAERVHRYIERDHHRLLFGREAEDAVENAQCSHDSATRNTGGSNHSDAEHEDETEHEREIEGNALHQHDSQCTSHNLECRARKMYGGTERHDEARNAFLHPVLDGLLKGLSQQAYY